MQYYIYRYHILQNFPQHVQCMNTTKIYIPALCSLQAVLPRSHRHHCWRELLIMWPLAGWTGIGHVGRSDISNHRSDISNQLINHNITKWGDVIHDENVAPFWRLPSIKTFVFFDFSPHCVNPNLLMQGFRSPQCPIRFTCFRVPIATSSCSGQHGWRNFQDGGETTSSQEPGPFLVYIYIPGTFEYTYIYIYNYMYTWYLVIYIHNIYIYIYLQSWNDGDKETNRMYLSMTVRFLISIFGWILPRWHSHI